MDACKYIHTNYVYNNENRIQLHIKDARTITIALSNDGKYVGKPTRASAAGLWMYLETGINPFLDLL